MLSTSTSAVSAKGRMLSLTQLTLDTEDAAAAEQALADYAGRVPAAMRDLPLVLDGPSGLPLAPALDQLRKAGLNVVAAMQGGLQAQARQLGLAVISPAMLGGARQAAAPASPEPAPAAAPARSTRLISTPVRSGQQIYAEGADLVITAAVSAGAEVIADGCVHVYGVLRGRAIAGARGNTEARVFCMKQEAELIAVAGIYAVADQIQDTRGQAVQALLTDDRLRIEPMPGATHSR